MEADYECPRCHNIFPSQNKIMHDARCTESNPMPLDISRQNILSNQNNPNQEEKKEKVVPELKNEGNKKHPEIIPKKENTQSKVQLQEPLKKMSESGEFPNIFVCDICGETLAESEKKDHMYCHNLEKEEKDKINNENNLEVSQGQIEQQKKIEKLIEKENEMRRQMQNQQSQQNQRQRDINRNINLNNLFDSNDNVLGESDMESFGNIGFPGISQTTIRTNAQNNPNGFSSIRIIRTGPNGQTYVQQYESGNPSNMMNPMRMNMFSGISGNQQRRMIPFSNLSFSEILDQLMNNLGNHEHPTDQQIINELPETQIDDVSKLDGEKKNCVICLEDFKNGDKAIVLPCIHLFHTPCIQNWLKTQNCCPICKFKLTIENLNNPPH